MKRKTMTVVKDEEQKIESKELIKRTPVDDTPFVIITIGDENFGTFGQYRITEEFKTIEECKKHLEAITWNRIVQIMTLVSELLTKNRK